MPTLFRMLMILIVLGGGFLGVLIYLGTAGEPQSQVISIDVPLERSGQGGS